MKHDGSTNVRIQVIGTNSNREKNIHNHRNKDHHPTWNCSATIQSLSLLAHASCDSKRNETIISVLLACRLYCVYSIHVDYTLYAVWLAADHTTSRRREHRETWTLNDFKIFVLKRNIFIQFVRRIRPLAKKSRFFRLQHIGVDRFVEKSVAT